MIVRSTKVCNWHIAAIDNEPRPTVRLRVEILSRGDCFGVAVGGFVEWRTVGMVHKFDLLAVGHKFVTSDDRDGPMRPKIGSCRSPRSMISALS